MSTSPLEKASSASASVLISTMETARPKDLWSSASLWSSSLRVVWKEMFKRFNRVEVLGETVRASSVVFNAIQSMHAAV